MSTTISLDRNFSSLGGIRVTLFYTRGALHRVSGDDIILHWLVLPISAHFPPPVCTVSILQPECADRVHN